MKGRRKFKVESLPLISIVIIVIVVFVAVLTNESLDVVTTKDETENYQMLGTIDTTNFSIMQAYYLDGDCVIKSNITTNDDEDVNTQRIYYTLYTEASDDVISSGFLTPTISIDKSDVQNKGNVIIDLYAVLDEADVESTSPMFRVVIDNSNIVYFVDVLKSLMNYDDLNDEQKIRLVKFIDLNIANKRLLNFYSGDVATILKPYVKETDVLTKEQQIEQFRQQIIKQYDYYSQLAELIGIDFNELLQNSLSFNDSSYVLPAIQKSIDYINNEMNDQIATLEVKAKNKGFDLTEYYQVKDSYPLKDQYEYLDEQIQNKNDEQ